MNGKPFNYLGNVKILRSFHPGKSRLRRDQPKDVDPGSSASLDQPKDFSQTCPLRWTSPRISNFRSFGCSGGFFTADSTRLALDSIQLRT